MISFLHNYLPDPYLLSFGFLSVRWYGFLMALAMGIGLLISVRAGKKAGISKETMIDLSIVAVIGGLIGARLYEVLLIEPAYYFQDPLRILKVWEGGLAIHGGIIGGFLGLWLYSRKIGISALNAAASMVCGLAFAQAVGRIGNWFNQELYGLPTSLPWGVPISLQNRVPGYEGYDFFHPVFLYEALGCLAIAIILCLVSRRGEDITGYRAWKLVLIYIGSYSLLRFFLEYIKIDPTFMAAGFRWPQILSLLAFSLSAISFFIIWKKNKQVS